jgi:thiol:disulfide interchange protein DsbD
MVMAFNISEVKAQIYDPISWTTSVEKMGKDQYKLFIKATIEPGWHLYSQEVPQGGPIPTKVQFEPSSNFMRIGQTKELDGKVVDDPVFEMKIKYFEGATVFTQMVKIKTEKSFDIIGSINFMVCDDKRCLPPKTVELKFNIEP